MPHGNRKGLERAPSGRIWNNLNNKINWEIYKTNKLIDTVSRVVVTKE